MGFLNTNSPKQTITKRCLKKGGSHFPNSVLLIVPELPTTRKVARPVNTSAFIGTDIREKDPPRAYWTKAFAVR